jgi:homoprotocatechuate degradation regulator HpaR
MTDAPPPAQPALRLTRRSLPIALLRARETVMGPIREMLAASGVNEQKWRVLRVLQEGGPMELTAVAAEACLLLPSLTRMIRPMEEDGLLRREVPKEDRRKVVVAVTEKGEALIRAHSAQSAAIFAQIEQRFGASRLDQLLDLLEELRTIDPRPLPQRPPPQPPAPSASAPPRRPPGAKG